MDIMVVQCMELRLWWTYRLLGFLVVLDGRFGWVLKVVFEVHGLCVCMGRFWILGVWHCDSSM